MGWEWGILNSIWKYCVLLQRRHTTVRPEKADKSNVVDLKHLCILKHREGIWFLSEIKGKPLEVPENGTILHVYNDHVCFD